MHGVSAEIAEVLGHERIDPGPDAVLAWFARRFCVRIARGFAGGAGAGLQSLRGRRTASEAFCLRRSKNRFPGVWEGAARDTA